MESILDIIQTNPLYFWGAFALFLLVVEVLTGTAWLLWAAMAAGVTGLATLSPEFAANVQLQWIVFGLLAIIMTFAGRPYAKKWLRGESPNDINHRILEGRKVKAIQAFEGNRGRVMLDGAEWTAILEGDGDVFEGQTLIVTGRIEGATLSVKMADQTD